MDGGEATRPSCLGKGAGVHGDVLRGWDWSVEGWEDVFVGEFFFFFGGARRGGDLFLLLFSIWKLFLFFFFFYGGGKRWLFKCVCLSLS